MLMEWNEHREIEKFKKMGIYRILPNRDGKQEYHYQVLKSATKNIDFMGATAHSFLHDFANSVAAGEKASALTKALENKVTVRILVTSKDLLVTEKHTKFEAAKIILDRLNKDYTNFHFGYSDQVPFYTLVRADNECIVGTIIPGVSSNITSAIHASTDSPFLKCYLDHFEDKCKVIS